MADEADWVSADGFIFDESSFYGNEEDKQSLEDHVRRFDPVTYWATQDQQLSVMVEKRKTEIRSSNSTTDPPAYATKPAALPATVLAPVDHPPDEFEGNPSGRQLSELVTTFLTRALPHTVVGHGLWLFITNPFAQAITRAPQRAAYQEASRRILESLETSIPEIT